MEEVFNGRQPSMEDDPRWKMTFGGRRLDRRQPLMKDDLRQKTTFDRRRPLMEDKRVFPTAAICVAVRHFSKNSEKFTFAIVLKPAYKELIKDWIPRACPGACSCKSFRNRFRNEFLKCFQECNFWSVIIHLNWDKWISFVQLGPKLQSSVQVLARTLYSLWYPPPPPTHHQKLFKEF